jgi:hypothetical protein
VDYVEFSVGVAIILMALYLRYVAGLRSGWELIIFWVFWIVGLILMKPSRKRKISNQDTTMSGR